MGLLEPEADAADTSASNDPLAQAILETLDRRGACFYMELERAARSAQPDARQDVIEAAIWDRVRAGQITNDTFAPLRSLGQRKTSARGRRRPGQGLAGGRWSRVADLIDADVSLTERAREQAENLLARYGVVSREMACAEGLPGGFGRADAVDRLRALEHAANDTPEPRWLASADPASPWGQLLPWPQPPEAAEGRLRRVAGALVALAGGQPLLYLAACCSSGRPSPASTPARRTRHSSPRRSASSPAAPDCRSAAA